MCNSKQSVNGNSEEGWLRHTGFKVLSWYFQGQKWKFLENCVLGEVAKVRGSSRKRLTQESGWEFGKEISVGNHYSLGPDHYITRIKETISWEGRAQGQWWKETKGNSGGRKWKKEQKRRLICRNLVEWPHVRNGGSRLPVKGKTQKTPCLKFVDTKKYEPWAPVTYLSSQQCVLRDSQTRW